MFSGVSKEMAGIRWVKKREPIHRTMLLPANIYLFEVNNRNTRKMCEICSKLTIKTPERRPSGVFIVNFEHISHLFHTKCFLGLMTFEKDIFK